ncbi:MAG: SpoIIE family protein phosphatase, partial [Firmicutes bacterium]|nr:SpoIIE family protein phosphatase [Bacillota bacterium]
INMWAYTKLVISIVVLVVTTGLVANLQRNGKIKNTYKTKFVLGIVFGILGVLGTELGVYTETSIFNIRDATIIVCGLFISGTSGVIAGLVAGIERWMAVAWGAPVYSTVACTMATIIVGFYVLALRKWVYNKKLVSFLHSAMIGFVAEIGHLFLLFITNMDTLEVAYSTTEQSLSMLILVPSVVVLSHALYVYIRENNVNFSLKARYIENIFQYALIIVMVIGLIFSISFSSVISHRIAKDKALKILDVSILNVQSDVKNQIIEIAEEDMSRIYHIYKIANLDILSQYVDKQWIDECFILNKENTVVYSNRKEMEGKKIPYKQLEKSEDESEKLIPSFTGDEETVKYYCADFGDYKCVIGYEDDGYSVVVANVLYDFLNNRNIGETGYFVLANVTDKEGVSIIPAEYKTYFEDENFSIYDDIPGNNDLLQRTIKGQDCYLKITEANGFYIIAVMPLKEIIDTSKISTTVNIFISVITMAIVTLLTFLLIRKLVIDNLDRVNNGLTRITEGKLETRISVTNNKEFEQLSKDINITVDKLKEYIHEAETRMDQDLAFARTIQYSSLPSVFPAFPNRKDFDIFAQIETAKEVGGDFYDLYMIDNRLIFTIADVSGKGIPASLFMMRAKTTLKNYIQTGISLNEAVKRTNEDLCQNNDADMFVTAWVGSLNLENGELSFVNAGHNYPVLCRNGLNEFLKSKVNFVLAGMDGVKYKTQTFQMIPGDTLILYTDGVTEAMNEQNVLFGDDRLLQALNQQGADFDTKTRCNALRESIKDFVQDAEQSDDITIMSLFYKGLDHES